MEAEGVIRLEVKLRNPNPLFKKWVEGWLRDAEKRDLKSKTNLRLALDSLQRYPLPLKSGRQCAILRGFGKKLCCMIDEELCMMKQDPTIPKEFDIDIDYEDELEQVVEEVKRRRDNLLTPKIHKKKEKQIQIHNEEVERQVTMSPGCFQIKLLVDTQETAGNHKRMMDKATQYLESHAIPFEIRRLAVGDFMWIASDKERNELLLPFVVERKRLDDLASSIRDGRFHEQKHRLRNSRIQNVIYLIEDITNRQHCALPYETLQQAIVNTRVHSKFTIVHTSGHQQTMEYLQRMTQLLIRLYKDKVLVNTSMEDLQSHHPKDNIVGLMKFIEVNKTASSSAQLSVRELFVKQLLQLHSLSFEKAVAIVEQYPTPKLLFDAYYNCKDSQEGRKLLAGIKWGPLQQTIGDKISQMLYDFYWKEF